MAQTPTVIDGRGLTVATIVHIARHDTPIALSEGARERISASAAYAAAAATRRPVYGRTTGVGANRTVTLEDPIQQALNLLRSHATSTGPERSPERVRAMLAIRLNQLAAGGSGVSLTVVDAVAAMMSEGPVPAVREYGGIGTGDLPALAAVALPIFEQTNSATRDTVHDGLQSGDALGFISSNAGALADAALALHELRSLAVSALATAALTHIAVDGNTEAYSAAAERATPFPGVGVVCRTLREYLSPGTRPAARIQDPFALRTLPQVHGALLDRLAELDTVIVALANAPSENPLCIPDLSIAHHGGFHAVYLAQAVDAVRSALTQAATLGISRVSMLMEPGYTGQTPFLSNGTSGSSGLMMLEYSAAAALSRLRATSAPVATQSTNLSRTVEDDASFAALAATTALHTISSYRTLIACELFAARRCLALRRLTPPQALDAWVNNVTAPTDAVRDRDTSADIATIEANLTRVGPPP